MERAAKWALDSFSFSQFVCLKKSTNPEPLVKRIMGYEQGDLSHILAINWGVQHESVARQQYTTMMSARHESL